MVDQEQLDKVIELYEASYSSGGVCVYRNFEVCDTDLASIWINNDILYFEFSEDDIEDFDYKISNIEKISFDNVGEMVVSIIKMKNGDTIVIHNF